MSGKVEDLFNTLYQTEYDRIFRLCKGYFNGHEARAQDAVQEVFVKIWENLPRYRAEAKLSTWVYRIAVNVCLMEIRKASYRKETYPASLPETAAEVTEEEVKIRKLYACIQSLDEVHRPLILMLLEGISYTDMAEIMGIKEEILRVKIHRIKQRLTKCVVK